MKKTIIITGSTDGIGKIAAMKLAKDGHKVYVHGRNQAKVLNTVQEIKEATGNGAIHGVIADLSDFKEVIDMADVLKKELHKIDVLINNAGVFKSPILHNKDGLDLRMVVNYLAPYVLTNKLIPLLNQGTEPRLLNLSSAAQSPVSHDVLRGTKQGSTGETEKYFDNDKGEFGPAHPDAYDKSKIDSLIMLTDIVLKKVV